MVDKVLFSGVKNNKKTAKDDWQTPKWVFDYYNSMFNFEWDLAADHKNHLAPKYYTEEDNALIQPWTGSCFLNSPYSLNDKFVKKAVEELNRNYENGTRLDIHLLIPSRTCTKYFHSMKGYANNIDFFKGRLKFINPSLPSYKEGGNFKVSGAPFPSCVVYLTTEIMNDPSYCIIQSVWKDKNGTVIRESW